MIQSRAPHQRLKKTQFQSRGLTEDSVSRVHRDLILRSIADESLGVSESNIGRSSAVALIIGDDLHPIMLPYADARVRRPEIDSDRRTFAFRHGNSANK